MAAINEGAPKFRLGSSFMVFDLMTTGLCRAHRTGKVTIIARPCSRGNHIIHIVPFGKGHRIGGAPPKTFPNVKYDAPEEVGGNRKRFDSPIRK